MSVKVSIAAFTLFGSVGFPGLGSSTTRIAARAVGDAVVKTLGWKCFWSSR
jgi:hypothetical protein